MSADTANTPVNAPANAPANTNANTNANASNTYPKPIPLCTTLTEVLTKYKFKCSLLGEPGKGKTHIAAITLLDEMYPAALIDIDKKAAAMPALTALRQQGKLDIFTLKAPLVNPRELKTVSQATIGTTSDAMPQAVLELIDLLNYIQGVSSLAVQAKKEGVFKEYKTVIIDTWSRLVEHIERLADYIQRNDNEWGKNWRKYKQLQENILSDLMQHLNMHVIVNCHIMEKVKSRTKNSEVKAWEPLISGEMKHKFVGFFNEVYFLKTVTASGGVLQYKMETACTGTIPARTSIVGLPKVIEPDLSAVVKMWVEQMQAK